VLAGPVLVALAGRRWRWSAEARRWSAGAVAGLVLDVLLKATLAPVWNRLLTSLAGW
jgi:hypothetical protein